MTTTQNNAPLRRVGDYALIGDCETAALVHRNGSIDWLCWPRFDSQACFASLLGTPQNGCWRIAPDSSVVKFPRRYRGDTLVLETDIETSEGAATLVDFMPSRGNASHIVRMVFGRRGRVQFESSLRPSFNYGRGRPNWKRAGADWIASSDSHTVSLRSDTESRIESGACLSSFCVDSGSCVSFVLSYAVDGPRDEGPIDPHRMLRETEEFWFKWVQQCSYDGPWREAVVRSLITMKALAYRLSGGIIAAPTSSLPECPGGTRNWDYRFCWLRDATFTLLAFIHSGFEDEAIAWRDWLVRSVADKPHRIQPIYGLTGETDLVEEVADWLTGFAGAQPVRFGNDAFRQHQLDTYGEVIDALHQTRAHGLAPDEAGWDLQLRIVEHVEKAWTKPDSGIWETRDEPKHFIYSKAMAWVALSRTLSAAKSNDMTIPYDRWKELREKIHAEICRRGFNPELNTFVRSYGSSELDASTLLLAQVGFLPPEDPRIVGTVDAIGRRLQKNGFIFRYDTQASPDGLPPGEAAFLACSFWYADALALIGRRDEAVTVFERILAIRNDVGLLSEEYDPSQKLLLGNFPQTLSHLALINTALNLSRSDGPARRRSGRV